MATLKIRNFPNDVLEKIRERARREHRSVSGQVIHMLSTAVEPPEPGSILDLQGLGKELWAGVEAGAHVNKERRSWN